MLYAVRFFLFKMQFVS